MGKGDKKSKKGKIAMGSFGVSRLKKNNASTVSRAPEKPKAEAKPAKEAKATPKAPVKRKAKEEKEK